MSDGVPPALRARLPSQAAWLFAYGSLIWEPRFEPAERRPALLYGYHRAFCIASHVWRGTREAPGLVLGLDRGGSCRGHALRIRPEEVGPVLDAVWAREMVTAVYTPAIRPVRTPDGPVQALVFLARHDHPQYAPERDQDAIAARIAGAHGRGGANREYLEETCRALGEAGIRDPRLSALAARVRRLAPAPDRPPS